MNRPEVRDALAAAASTVDGITCHPYYVQNTKPGAAYVRLDRIEYPNAFGGVAHWHIVVVLPQDQARAEKYIDTVVQPLRDALAPELVITKAQPTRLQLPDHGVLSCVFIHGHRED